MNRDASIRGGQTYDMEQPIASGAWELLDPSLVPRSAKLLRVSSHLYADACIAIPHSKMMSSTGFIRYNLLMVGFGAFAIAAPHILGFQANTHRLLGSSFGIPGDNATFDYVVIGGGTAGLTVATRLAEQQSGRVAIVEAGSFYEIGNG